MSAKNLTAYPIFPIGTVGETWDEEDKKKWQALQSKKRDYFNDVVSPLMRIPASTNLEVFQYGNLDYRCHGAANYPLYAVKTSAWKEDQKLVVVTGGVHGYETSGVHGALLFIQTQMQAYAAKGFNILVLPCVSPWGYEMIQRWNPLAIDPNRQFNLESPGCDEAAQAMSCIQENGGKKKDQVIVHCDLHETTDQDNTEFRPAKFARDGQDTTKQAWDPIPDGFYSVGDYRHPQVDYHKHVLAAVKEVTHIAPGDDQGRILEVPLSAPGLIHPAVEGICGNHTSATFKVTTEVYPDSDKCNDEICNRAQCVVITSSIDYAIANPKGDEKDAPLDGGKINL